MPALKWMVPVRTILVVSSMEESVFALADQAFGIAANCGAAARVAVSIHIQYISPATGSLVAVAHRVAENGRYSTFRVMVYEEERIIAQFDGVAIEVNTP